MKETYVQVLLIHPPVVKPGEPPAGIAQLAGALRGHGIACLAIDASLEGMLFLLEQEKGGSDTWSQRAKKNRSRNLAALKNRTTYRNPDRYKQTVRDLNRAIEQSCDHALITLTNYQDRTLSPLRSSDLLLAADRFAASPYFVYFKKRLSPLLREEHYTHVGISLTYLSQAISAFALIGFLRAHHPQVSIIVGGGLITSWISSPKWHNPFPDIIDHLVAGPGEIPLLHLLKTEYEQRHPPDFSDLPIKEYLSPGIVLPYAASMGCYWNRCSFCPEKAEGSTYSAQPADRVLKELNLLCGQVQPHLIHFLDNAISPVLMRHLVADPPGPYWYGFARINRQLTDLDFCMALRQSGCVLLKLGLESGNQQILDKMHKGITLELAEEVLQTLHQAGIGTYVYLLFGTPQESRSQARDTLDFCVTHQETITFCNLALFNLPRFSLESRQFLTHDFYQGDLSLYSDFSHPQGWSRKKIRTFLDREFKRHPALAPIIQRDPPLFTSNHAPFFCMDW